MKVGEQKRYFVKNKNKIQCCRLYAWEWGEQLKIVRCERERARESISGCSLTQSPSLKVEDFDGARVHTEEEHTEAN